MDDMTREPSMEEILSSIRRVIARDEDARAAHDGGGVDGNADNHDEILELTQDIVVGTAHEDSSLADEIVASTAADGLISSVSEQASRQSLEALSAALDSGNGAAAKPQTPPATDVTLSAMVESMLRPMLRQWLDTNLPPLVERLVAREIARITGNRF